MSPAPPCRRPAGLAHQHRKNHIRSEARGVQNRDRWNVDRNNPSPLGDWLGARVCSLRTCCISDVLRVASASARDEKHRRSLLDLGATAGEEDGWKRK
jgi:hypothetical protein